ncbi:hypothetical protein [Escherichia phage e4/1c]|uniref:Uncharacterized protein n=1 Tax=Escherichia phage e4/1c TaxID=1495286 RepID=A0A023ZTX6_9CAUD|nr:hypothetical protein e41c_0066 [Escherichia phage e4/1c]AHY83216.1 hypothetical protein [Escherichia phage e4/1c]
MNEFKIEDIILDDAVYYHENDGFDTECMADDGIALIIERDKFGEIVQWSEQ